ncbi:MAG: polysaccharide deacetylase family protein [Planctomycetota bacterium]|nr:polysaccharide deacetylase family protein [Planctomycetota bacterium]
MIKHRLKGWFRTVFGRCVWHTGLWRLFDALTQRRLLILAGHCVGPAPGLPRNMTLSEGRLLEILQVLGRSFDWCTVGDGVKSIQDREATRSLIALSFDDGYRDNCEVLLPILDQTCAKATVFLEGAPISQNKVSWSHKYFWLIHVAKVSPEQIVEELLGVAESAKGFQLLKAAAAGPKEEREYQVKRTLKYQCLAEERNAAMQRIFLGHGGVEAELRERLYLSPQQILELRRAGVELGGHTEGHEALATLSPEQAYHQVQTGRTSMEGVLGSELSTSFAYPFGRRWDFDESTKHAVIAAGYDLAVTTHPGVYRGQGDTMTLGRTMLTEDLPIYQIMMEACGAYQWLRGFGIELAE